MKRFGPNAARDDDIEVIPTPVGELCFDCNEPIEDGQWGVAMPFGDTTGWREVSIHGECEFREIMGGIEHLTAPKDHPVGTCYDNSPYTRRQSAVLAFQWWREHGRMDALTPERQSRDEG